MAEATQSHCTSLAVWDVPSTVIAGEQFTIRAGAKSSAASNLQGQRIAVRTISGAVVSSAALGSARWPDTEALYWTELSLPAPTRVLVGAPRAAGSSSASWPVPIALDVHSAGPSGVRRVARKQRLASGDDDRHREEAEPQQPQDEARHTSSLNGWSAECAGRSRVYRSPAMGAE